MEYRPLSPSLLWYGEETLKLDLVWLISALRDFIMLGKEMRQFAMQRESGVFLIFCVKVYLYVFLWHFLSLLCKWFILVKLCHFSSILIQFTLAKSFLVIKQTEFNCKAALLKIIVWLFSSSQWFLKCFVHFRQIRGFVDILWIL